MQPIDVLAAVGEVLSWIGLGIGIPVLIVAGMIAIAEGRWEPVDIAVIDRDGVPIARWFAGGDFHERPLRRTEGADVDWHRGFVSVRNPDHARFSVPVMRRLLATVGVIFTTIGVIGLIVSLLPAFV